MALKFILNNSRPTAVHTVLCTAHNTHAIPGHAATPPHNKLRRNVTECFNINITLASLNCKLPDDGRRTKHVGAI